MPPLPEEPSDTNSRTSLVESLAEDYLSRLRAGQSPRIAEYVAKHPELAEEIRDVLNTLAMLEDFAPDHEHEDVQQISDSYSDMPRRVGRYKIVRELGRGGMGVVFEAEHETMQRRVALKLLYPHMAKRNHDRERFLRETRVAGRLHHTNIVPVFEVGEENGTPYYAMQRIRGQNLDLIMKDLRTLRTQDEKRTLVTPSSPTCNAAEYLHSGHFERSSVQQTPDENCHDGPQGSPSESTSSAHAQVVVPDSSEMSHVGHAKESYCHRVAKVGLQVADSLAYAHEQGILHRDIKPANLILDTTGTVWVTDFGLARSEDDAITHSGDIVGTLRYMAPERFGGQADARSDVYSLGLTLYEMCTLRHAFDQEDRADVIRNIMRCTPPPPSRFGINVPRDLETIVLKSISREPSDRYQSAMAMADDLRLFLSDRPINARRTSTLEQTWRWCRRNPASSSMLGCILGLLCIISVGATVFALRARRHAEAMGRETVRATQAELAEQKAHAESLNNLYQAYVSQARAERQNQLRSEATESLRVLSKASQLLPALPLSEVQRGKERLRLRGEAIALLGQMNLVHDPSTFPGDFGSRTVAFDGNYRTYATSRGDIEIRSAFDDSVLQRIPQHEFRATDIRFSHDRRYLASIHRQGSAPPRYVRVWDLKSNASILEKEIFATDIRFSLIDPQSGTQRLAIISNDGEVTVYDLHKLTDPMKRDFETRVWGVAFAPRANRLAVVGDAGVVSLWSLEQDEIEKEIPLPTKAASVDWCRATNRLAVGLQNGPVCLLHVDEQQRSTLVDPDAMVELRGHVNSVHSIAISPTGEILASSAWMGRPGCGTCDERKSLSDSTTLPFCLHFRMMDATFAVVTSIVKSMSTRSPVTGQSIGSAVIAMCHDETISPSILEIEISLRLQAAIMWNSGT